MSDIFDALRAAGVTDFRFCLGNGGADSFPEDYQEEQLQIIEAVLVGHDPGVSARCAEVDALRDQLLRSGYAFEVDGSRHAIQTRGEDDRLNWLGVLAACQALAAAGQGAESLSIRTAANDTLTMPAAGLAQVLLGALAHQSAIYAAAWVHKDAIRQGDAARDITTGWPGQQ